VTNEPSKIVATYDYRDVAGNLLHQTARFEPKRFSAANVCKGRRQEQTADADAPNQGADDQGQD
jgi:hypothetical protein